jgi:signal transduction histidine kinase
VDPAALGRIFEKRVRGPQSRGQGLGLYLVRRLCQRLGWRVTVANRDTGGARFSVAFDGQQSSPSK